MRDYVVPDMPNMFVSDDERQMILERRKHQEFLDKVHSLQAKQSKMSKEMLALCEEYSEIEYAQMMRLI